MRGKPIEAATAAASISGAAGLILGSRRRHEHGFLAALTGVSLALLGVSLAMAGLFPLPNPLHYGFGLTAAGLLTPALGALTLLRRNVAGAVPWLLMPAFGAGIVLLAINLGACALVSASNAGLWLRALAFHPHRPSLLEDHPSPGRARATRSAGTRC